MCIVKDVSSNSAKQFWRYHIFLIFKMAADRHLGFILKFLVAHQPRRANMLLCTRFHQNRSNGCRDITFNNFQNSGRSPSWIILKLIFLDIP